MGRDRGVTEDDREISARTLQMMDASMASLEEGHLGEPLDPDAMLSNLDAESVLDPDPPQDRE